MNRLGSSRAGVSLPADAVELHVAMLSDRARTASYLEAIRNVVRPGDVVVDIGTGTGILALAAARAGARRVYAIEVGRVARIARRIFEANDVSDRIRLVRGLSTRVRLPERADVLVSELVGNEPLGERVLGVTKDALRRLLKPGARLVPSGIRLVGVPVTIPDRELAKLVFTPRALERWEDWYDFDLRPLAEVVEPPLFRHFVNPYVARKWKALTRPVDLVDVDFRSWREPRIWTRKAATATTGGELNGFIVYFELKVGEETFFSTNPTGVGDDNHWESPVQVFDPPLRIRRGDRLGVTYWYGFAHSLSACRILLDS